MDATQGKVWLESRRQEALSAAAAALPAAMVGEYEGFYDEDASKATRMLARFLIGEFASIDNPETTPAGPVLASFGEEARSEEVGMAVAQAAVKQAKKLRPRIDEWLMAG